MAAPGSTHYGYYIISYEFVYVGNMHVRNVLVIFALFSVLAAFVTFVTSILLVAALRKVSWTMVHPPHSHCITFESFETKNSSENHKLGNFFKIQIPKIARRNVARLAKRKVFLWFHSCWFFFRSFGFFTSSFVRLFEFCFVSFSCLLFLCPKTCYWSSSTKLETFLSQEYETKIVPWLWSFGIFTGFRFFAFLFFAIVNDLIFFYNIAMTMLWIIFISVSIYGWLVVYSLYLELSDLTKLEDLAHLRVSMTLNINRIPSLNFLAFQMGTMQSLNASAMHSLAGSRPTTPHSTVSTMPISSIH